MSVKWKNTELDGFLGAQKHWTRCVPWFTKTLSYMGYLVYKSTELAGFLRAQKHWTWWVHWCIKKWTRWVPWCTRTLK